ncbi:MAG TPA: DUF4093 domain-containing protein [Candidatus Limousia pullorum]|uniref:DUF4093 domain-containing protein n=1 Tax=Candidatus Limousia pullorum TaxID=2840860 RepID=A0A9D1LY14_9FIRM|nr:DUF4093 domain-containing protein [Anaeromassilibacillus sp. An172]MEE0762853.1 DUF4093 domain-containing protein [Acutalibacteraceae bacterium]OUP78260.1 ribonuclease M5 [Anaeromassilibacillus sp. An172]HIU50118.1 DUF4093 domain-containing protein [Candidatus Limousia pullorum]
MIKLNEAVIVEGRYDKILLRGFIDAPIIETGGFRVFKDKEKQKLIRKLSETRGIIIMTDSDSAGFVIRNFLRGIVPAGKIKHCYIPQIRGKEKRKAEVSKEGYLGVEGLDEKTIIEALERSGVNICSKSAETEFEEITKADFYELGLSGKENSAKLREKLLKKLGMPTYLSANAFLAVLNCFYSKKDLLDILREI